MSARREVACDYHGVAGCLVDGPIEIVPRLMTAEFKMGIGEPDQALDVVRHAAVGHLVKAYFSKKRSFSAVCVFSDVASRLACERIRGGRRDPEHLARLVPKGKSPDCYLLRVS